MGEPRRLVIDEAYLRQILAPAQVSERGVQPVFDQLRQDLRQLGSEDLVELVRPTGGEYRPLCADVIAYVATESIGQGYRMRSSRRFDVDRIRAVLGGHVSGDEASGYRFDKHT